MTGFAIKLVLAHLIGDFLLQPEKWVRHKEAYKHRSGYLYAHIGIHALALLILLQFDLSYWKGILLLLTSHLIVDYAKIRLKNKCTKRWLFFADQLAHFSLIAWVVYLYFPFTIRWEWLLSAATLMTVIFLLLVSVVASVVIKILISWWADGEGMPVNNRSLKNAGMYIGILERLFIFVFIITDHWEGIGFLLAAKSVFRFGDLSKASDRKYTEYVLIGTLLSFGLAISAGMLYLHIKASGLS